MLSRTSAAVLTILFAALPAAAGTWHTLEPVGGFAGNGFYGGDVLSYGIYNERYGFGAGTKLAQLRGETWDLPRHAKPDASSHGILVPLPLEIRVVLKSWEGAPFVDYVYAESSNGRLELHGWYCPWAFFGAMDDVGPDVFGARSGRRSTASRARTFGTWDSAMTRANYGRCPSGVLNLGSTMTPCSARGRTAAGTRWSACTPDTLTAKRSARIL